MKNVQTQPVSDAIADGQIVANCLAAGKTIPPDVAARVRERGAQARQAILDKLGVQDIGVPIIREMRGDE